MEVTQNFMDEMRGMMKALMGSYEMLGAQMKGLTQQVEELRAEVTDIRETMATKDDIRIIHEEIADLKSDYTYLKHQSYKNRMDIYHLKLQMGNLHNEEQGPLQD